MATYNSPVDPMFYLYHCLVDYIFMAKAKLENCENPDAYHKAKERGHVQFSKDVQQQELEERLGFGYEELYYLYRENTEINVRCHRLEHENKWLTERVVSLDPAIVVCDGRRTACTCSRIRTSRTWYDSRRAGGQGRLAGRAQAALMEKFKARHANTVEKCGRGTKTVTKVLSKRVARGRRKLIGVYARDLTITSLHTHIVRWMRARYCGGEITAIGPLTFIQSVRKH